MKNSIIRRRKRFGGLFSRTGSGMGLILILGFLLLFFSYTAAWAGEATLSWDPPTTRMDGTPLTDLAGYKVYYGTASATYTQVVEVGLTSTPATPTYTIANLADGNTYFFAVTAYYSSGNESDFSNEASKTIPTSLSTGSSEPTTINGGGCGMISPTGGKSRGPGAGADMLALIMMPLILFIKRKVLALKSIQISRLFKESCFLIKAINHLTFINNFGLYYLPQLLPNPKNYGVSILRMKSTRTISQILFLVVFLFTSSAEAATYYADPVNGSDSNLGTLAQPWQHICYAIGGGGRIWTTDPGLVLSSNCSTSNPTKLSAGDTLFLRAGTYKEYWILISSGANVGQLGNPITLKAYSGETPIVDGGAQVSYCWPTPDATHGTYCGTKEPVFWIDYGRSYWTIDGLTIQNGVTAGVFVGDDCPSSVGDVVQNSEIRNIVVLDNTPGIYVSGCAQGFVAKNNVIHPETSSYSTRGNCIQMWFSTSDHDIENNECYHAVNGIMYKEGTTGTPNTTIVKNNLIHDIYSAVGGSAVGIESSTDNMVIQNNLIYNIGGSGSGSGVGIGVYKNEHNGVSGCGSSGGNNSKIIHNTIVNTTDSGIYLGEPSQCHGLGAKNTVVKDNLIYKTTTNSLGSMTIWPYWTTNAPSRWHTPWTILANVGQLVMPSTGSYFANPVDFYYPENGPGGSVGTTSPNWASCTTPGCAITDGTVTWIAYPKNYHKTTSDYNLVWSTDTNSVWRLYGNLYSSVSAWNTATKNDPGSLNTAQDVHSIQKAPVFVDYAGNDFTLASGSPGKNAGSDRRDMGGNVCSVGVNPSCPPPNNPAVK